MLTSERKNYGDKKMFDLSIDLVYPFYKNQICLKGFSPWKYISLYVGYLDPVETEDHIYLHRDKISSYNKP